MNGERGPEYADKLTEEERRTLDTLLARQSAVRPFRARAASRGRRAWYVPAAAAAAAVLVLLAVGSVRLLAGPREPGVRTDRPAGAPPLSATETLAALADAAGRSADRPAAVPYRRTLEIVVRRTGTACGLTAATTQTWLDAGVEAPRPPAGRLVAGWATVPAAVAGQMGCAVVDPSTAGPVTGTLFDGTTQDLSAEWARLADANDGLARYAGPWRVSQAFQVAGRPLAAAPLTAPDDLARFLAKMCGHFAAPDCTAFAWTVLAEALASPQVNQAQRAAALRYATSLGGAATVPAATGDATGRPGTTLRVPCLALGRGGFADGQQALADLTFDAGTGALLQLAVRAPDGKRTEVTVYVPAP